ncbi:MAG: sigma-70 family RNA polymerase sigma factor [Polyangia bacterium]|nr:sigma-70 family RNA polymerase sigma factor [Polyangia bacterium]
MPEQAHIGALIDRVRSGEPEAFTALVRSYLRPAYSVALAIVGRPADAQDVAQEALLKAFQRIGDCREPSSFGGWLMQIVRNEGRNWLRSRRLRDVSSEEPKGELPSQGPAADQGVLRRELLGALQTLTEAQREVVLLHDLEGWTHQEIAQALGLSETMSRQHLFQARRKLRALLGAHTGLGAGAGAVAGEREGQTSSPEAAPSSELVSRGLGGTP